MFCFSDNLQEHFTSSKVLARNLMVEKVEVKAFIVANRAVAISFAEVFSTLMSTPCS